uniref:hypothetical protein n=1 Tax=Campylobacter hyointestinalis TaxID=198 RepID=UPI003AF8EB2E
MAIKELYPFYISQKGAYLLIDKEPSLTFTFDNDVVTFSDGSNFTLTDNNFIDISFEETRVNYRFYNPYFSLFDLCFGKLGYTGGVGNSRFNVSYSISSKIINLKKDDGSEEYNLNVSSIQDFLQLENSNKSFLDSSFSSADRYYPLSVYDKSYCFLIKDKNLLDSFGSIKDSVFTYSSSTALPDVMGKPLPIIFNGVRTSYYTQKDSPLYEFLNLRSSSGLELTINSDYSISTNKDDVIAVLDREKNLIKIREGYHRFFSIDYSDFSLFSSIASKPKEPNNSEISSDIEKEPSNNLPVVDEDDFSGRFGNFSKDEVVYCSLYLGYVFKVKKVTILQNNLNSYTFTYVLKICGKYNDSKEIIYLPELETNVIFVPSSFVSNTII